MRHAFLLCAVPVTFLNVVGRANAQDAPFPRVRTDDPAIATVIDEARRRSATFRSLIDTIGRSDGLVYIEAGECSQHVPACMSHSVQLAGPNRVLRVRIDPRRGGLDRGQVDPELIGRLGHELQHVVEVLNNPRLRSNAAIATFYLREGTYSAGTAETSAAERAGITISEEAQRNR
jgi:hypothetical protein